MRHSRKELARVTEESFIDCWTAALSSSARALLWKEPDVILFSTGAPSSFSNGVLRTRFTPRNMATRTERILSFFDEKKIPMTWYVEPSSTPLDLSGYLQRRGLEPGWEIPGMAIDLGDVKHEPLPLELDIQPVENMETLRVCADTAAYAFGGEEGARNWRRADVYMAFGISSTKRWFLGYLDRRPVAVSFLVLRGGLAVLWIVATLEEVRGRGIETTMSRQALLMAKNMGYDFVVIHASEKGLPVYKELGFKEYCKIKTYTWSPS